MNRLRYRTVSCHQFENSLLYVFGQSPFIGSTLRPRGGENIDFYLLKLLHSYFTFLRWIDWDKEQSHTTTLKMPYVFGQSPFLGSTLRPCGGENIDIYLLKLLHSYFTFLRRIDWDVEQSHTTTLNFPLQFLLDMRVWLMDRSQNIVPQIKVRWSKIEILRYGTS